MSENYYDILGVEKDATETEIKRAYRALSLIYHPDRNADQDEETRTEKTAKFKDISSAYETLKDGELRKRYDMEQRMGAGFSFGRSMAQSEDM